KNVSLSDEEWERCKSSFTPKRMRRNQFFLQEGDICKRIAFIEKGALYSYSTDKKENQRVIQFGFEGWWIADLYSYFNNERSNLNIEVLEDCELLLADRVQHDKLLQEVPEYGKYTRII